MGEKAHSKTTRATVSATPGEEAEHRHAESQQDGVQETLAFLLHFHHQQFQPVFTDGQQLPRKTFRRLRPIAVKLMAAGCMMINRCANTGGRPENR